MLLAQHSGHAIFHVNANKVSDDGTTKINNQQAYSLHPKDVWWKKMIGGAQMQRYVTGSQAMYSCSYAHPTWVWARLEGNLGSSNQTLAR